MSSRCLDSFGHKSEYIYIWQRYSPPIDPTRPPPVQLLRSASTRRERAERASGECETSRIGGARTGGGRGRGRARACGVPRGAEVVAERAAAGRKTTRARAMSRAERGERRARAGSS